MFITVFQISEGFQVKKLDKISSITQKSNEDLVGSVEIFHRAVPKTT